MHHLCKQTNDKRRIQRETSCVGSSIPGKAADGDSGHLTICPSINHWERQRPVTAGLGDLSNYCCPPLPKVPPLLLLRLLSLPWFLPLVLLCSITKCSGQLPGVCISCVTRWQLLGEALGVVDTPRGWWRVEAGHHPPLQPLTWDCDEAHVCKKTYHNLQGWK